MKDFEKVAEKHGIKFHAVGDYTFCYRIDRADIIEVSSALRNPKDTPSYEEGKKLAFERFVAMNRMHMRIPAAYRGDVRSFLTATFLGDRQMTKHNEMQTALEKFVSETELEKVDFAFMFIGTRTGKPIDLGPAIATPTTVRMFTGGRQDHLVQALLKVVKDLCDQDPKFAAAIALYTSKDE